MLLINLTGMQLPWTAWTAWTRVGVTLWRAGHAARRRRPGVHSFSRRAQQRTPAGPWVQGVHGHCIAGRLMVFINLIVIALTAWTAGTGAALLV